MRFSRSGALALGIVLSLSGGMGEANTDAPETAQTGPATEAAPLDTAHSTSTAAVFLGGLIAASSLAVSVGLLAVKAAGRR